MFEHIICLFESQSIQPSGSEAVEQDAHVVEEAAVVVVQLANDVLQCVCSIHNVRIRRNREDLDLLQVEDLILRHYVSSTTRLTCIKCFFSVVEDTIFFFYYKREEENMNL